MSEVWRTVTAVTAFGCAASGGAFLVFSTLAPWALRRLPDAAAMAAMQQINLAAPRSASFMTLVFAPGLASAVLLVRALLRREPDTHIAVAGTAVYVLGVLVVTAAHHVPRNDALAALDAASEHEVWGAWLRDWVAANHLRTVSGLAAAGLWGWSLHL